MVMDKILVNNKKARYNYIFLEEYVAGIQLLGSEVKSLRESKASITEAYCYFNNEELFIKNMHINEWKFSGTYNSHETLRERKLLLTKKELKKLNKRLSIKGLTIIPVNVFVSKRGYIKLNIALAKGKKLWNKKQSKREKDIDRDTQREIKNNIDRL